MPFILTIWYFSRKFSCRENDALEILKEEDRIIDLSQLLANGVLFDIWVPRNEI
jgi:hypothetical protein